MNIAKQKPNVEMRFSSKEFDLIMGQTHHHSRVRIYMKKKLGIPAYQDVATRLLRGE